MLNQVVLMGRPGKDPEIKHSRDGARKFATFRMATTEKWKDKSSGERKEATEWHNVVVYNEGLVNLVEKYVRKGKLIYLSGKLQTRSWKGDDGKDRYATEVVLKAFDGEIKILEWPDDDDARSAREEYKSRDRAPPKHEKSFDKGMDDEIPF